MSSRINRPTTIKAEAFGRIGVLFFHGSGGNGKEWKVFFDSHPLPTFDLLTFRQVLQLWTQENSTQSMSSCELYCPTAELRPYSPYGREESHVWHDRSPNFLSEGMQSNEDKEGIIHSLQQICEEWINIDNQHHFDHYFIGGMSMGGGFALQFLQNLSKNSHFSHFSNEHLHHLQSKVRGIFTAGSFLVQDSMINDHKIPLFQPLKAVLMLHGKEDDLISTSFGRQTAANLLIRDINVDFQEFEDVQHEMTTAQVGVVLQWMKSCLLEYYRMAESDVAERYHKRKTHQQAVSYHAMEKEKYQDRYDYAGYDGTSEPQPVPTRKSSQVMEDYSRQQAAMKSEDHRHRVDSHPHAQHDVEIDHLAYSIEYLDESKQEESKLSMVAPRVRIRFECQAEHVPLMTSRPVLACGSMFEIKADHPYGVKTEAHTNDPHRTAMEISKRLFIRIHSGSASLNPCQPS